MSFIRSSIIYITDYYICLFSFNSWSTPIHACLAESILQKLGKLELGLQEEQKVCEALKARHVAATAEQRRCYSLLKAFQVNALLMTPQLIDRFLTLNSSQ